MDDLISRQAAIDALCKRCDLVADEDEPCTEKCNDIKILEMLPSAQLELSMEIQEILNYLDTTLHPIVSPDNWNVYAELHDMVSMLPSAQQWIPCSERLPDNDESVLISNSHGVTKAWWNGRFWTSIAVKKYKTVTAWMPLPEPYKGEQE